MVIEPQPEVLLIELAASNHGDLPIGEQYNEITQGVVIKINPEDKEFHGKLLNRTVYFRQFKGDCQIFHDKKKLALIELKDILGSSYAPENTTA